MGKALAAHHTQQPAKNSNVISYNSGTIIILEFPSFDSMGKALGKFIDRIPYLIVSTMLLSVSSSTNINSLPSDVISRTAAQVYQCRLD